MMHCTKLFLPLLALVAFVTLTTTEISVVSGVSGGGGDDDARQSLLKADKDWLETLHDPDAFIASLASEVIFLPPDAPRVHGPEAFRSNLDPVLQMPGVKLTWSPDVAEVSGGGDLGYTLGTLRLTLDGPDGEPVTRVGKYVTIWKRGEDERWKVVADTFNFDAPVPE